MTDDRPLRGPLPWIIAWRFLRGDRTRLLDGTARAALAAIALGVTAMVIAMALMTGYREELERKLVGANSAVMVSPLGSDAGALPPSQVAALRAIPGVVQVGRVAYGQGMLSVPGGPEVEVVLRGVDPGGAQLAARASQLVPGPGGVPGAVLGAELAHRLGVRVGGTLRLVALGFESLRPRFRYQSLRVTGTFETGFAEFDNEWVLLDRPLVMHLMGEDGYVDLYEFTLGDPRESPRVASRAREILGPSFLVTDWRDLNRELFTALEVQQIALFLVLGLIVLVSTFNVASTLVVLVRERMRDIGVLGAMGMGPGRLRGVFLAYGGALGAAGTLLGVAVGGGAAELMDRFHLIRFNPEVAAIYFIRSVPFRVEGGDLAAVVAFTLVVTLLACLVPAWRAARVDPSQALRYE